MKRFLRILCFTFFCFGSLAQSKAQTCPTGFTATAINWDAMAFLVQNATYVPNSIAANQKFAFGKN